MITFKYDSPPGLRITLFGGRKARRETWIRLVELNKLIMRLAKSSYSTGQEAGIMAVLLAALVEQLRIIGPNPSQSHGLEEVGGKRRIAMDGGRTGFSAQYLLVTCAHLYLKKQ